MDSLIYGTTAQYINWIETWKNGGELVFDKMQEDVALEADRLWREMRGNTEKIQAALRAQHG